MRFNEITEPDVLRRARRGARQVASRLRNRFSTPQGEPSAGGTVGQSRGGFLSGFAKGLGSPELANALKAAKSATPSNVAPVAPVDTNTNAAPAGPADTGSFPFPSSVPPQDTAMGYAPPPVAEPEPSLNQPQNAKLARKKSKRARIPTAESTDIAEALWRKMKRTR